jgi:hypothetical protein
MNASGKTATRYILFFAPFMYWAGTESVPGFYGKLHESLRSGIFFIMFHVLTVISLLACFRTVFVRVYRLHCTHSMPQTQERQTGAATRHTRARQRLPYVLKTCRDVGRCTCHLSIRPVLGKPFAP